MIAVSTLMVHSKAKIYWQLRVCTKVSVPWCHSWCDAGKHAIACSCPCKKAGAANVKLLLENACNPVAENLLVSHTALAVLIWIVVLRKCYRRHT